MFAGISWPLAIASVGVQAALVGLAFIGFFLPLTVRFARRVHRKRAVFLWVGAMASIVPLMYFGQAAAASGLRDWGPYLGLTVFLVLMQVLLYLLEDQRSGPSSVGPDSRFPQHGDPARPTRSPVR
jgi:hypothetical protein